MWQFDTEQAARLLAHRCKLIAFEEDLDEAGLRSGSVAACLPILRHLFIDFSEALCSFFEAEGHPFDPSMNDEEFMRAILAVWHLLSNEQLTGIVTVVKLLHPTEWGDDRLLFTLQCIAVCWRKHTMLVAQSDDDWFHGINETASPSPRRESQSQSSKSYDPQSTMLWMAEAYREQLASLNCLSGAAEQQVWMHRLRSSTGSTIASQEEACSIDSIEHSVE